MRPSHTQPLPSPPHPPLPPQPRSSCPGPGCSRGQPQRADLAEAAVGRARLRGLPEPSTEKAQSEGRAWIFFVSLSLSFLEHQEMWAHLIPPHMPAHCLPPAEMVCCENAQPLARSQQLQVHALLCLSLHCSLQGICMVPWHS